jgi:uncharacterized membrane protein YkvA (DUF1232 family)
MDQHTYDFYQDLRYRIRERLSSKNGSAGKWAEYLMLAPDLFHLLCKLAIDKEVPVKERAKLGGATAYFIAPFDLVPEALVGVIGFADDIALAAYVLNSLVNTCNPDILKRHWAGDDDILDLIQRILRLGDRVGRTGVLGKGVWKKIKGMFK